MDQRRRRYDEFIASGDRALGDFLAAVEKSGRLQNTTVIVSADHGESFEGGVYEHSSEYLTRPVVHIPLVIKTPGVAGTQDLPLNRFAALSYEQLVADPVGRIAALYAQLELPDFAVVRATPSLRKWTVGRATRPKARYRRPHGRSGSPANGRW